MATWLADGGQQGAAEFLRWILETLSCKRLEGATHLPWADALGGETVTVRSSPAADALGFILVDIAGRYAPTLMQQVYAHIFNPILKNNFETTTSQLDAKTHICS